MKRIVFAFLMTLSAFQLFACDICGCSSGNFFLGPMPQFNKHFIGLRYSFRSFNTMLQTDNSQFSKDFYQTTELWGGFKIKNNFQVLGFIPYNFNHSTTDDGAKTNNGIGEITLIGNYNLFNKIDLNKDTLSTGQQLWIGAGIKLPTGPFSVDTTELVSSANSQTGTGSIDFLLTATYSLFVDDWGLNSNINYKINQTASNFKFGNRFTATVFAFRSFHLKNETFSPNIGLIYENLNPNKLSKTEIESTGGNDLLGAIGLEMRFDSITIGLNVQHPLAENISDGQTKNKLRGMLHLTYTF